MKGNTLEGIQIVLLFLCIGTLGEMAFQSCEYHIVPRPRKWGLKLICSTAPKSITHKNINQLLYDKLLIKTWLIDSIYIAKLCKNTVKIIPHQSAYRPFLSFVFIVQLQYILALSVSAAPTSRNIYTVLHLSVFTVTYLYMPVYY